MRPHRLSALASVAVLVAGLHTGPGFGSSHEPYLHVNPISNQLSLETRIALSPGNQLFVADLFDNGTQNQIDLHVLNAGASGTSLVSSHANLSSGDVFGMGDWCIGPNYAAFPYVDANGGSFDIRVGGYALGSGTTMDMPIPDSIADRFTSTDCSTLDNGDFIISAQNFDAGRIDFFRSTDQGLSWNLSASFNPPGGSVVSAFDGYRPAADAVGNSLGVTYQLDDGLIRARLFDPLDGSSMGPVNIFSHPADIGNGLIKECDGIHYSPFAFGLCNSGTDVWSGVIGTTDGGLSTRFLNNIGPGSSLSFFGVSTSAGVFGGETQFHTFSNGHHVIPLVNDTWTDTISVSGYPFGNLGGPVDSAASSSLERLYVAGNTQGGGNQQSYLAVATVDPTLIEAQEQPDGLPIPALSAWTATLLGTILLVLGLSGARRRSTN